MRSWQARNNSRVINMENLPLTLIMLLLAALAVMAIGLTLTLNQGDTAGGLINIMTGALQSLIAK